MSEFWERAIESLPTASIGKPTLKRRFIFFSNCGMMVEVGTLNEAD
ncbi:hypothetical protein [Microcoleus vaginatus]